MDGRRFNRFVVPFETTGESSERIYHASEPSIYYPTESDWSCTQRVF